MRAGQGREGQNKSEGVWLVGALEVEREDEEKKKKKKKMEEEELFAGRLCKVVN